MPSAPRGRPSAAIPTKMGVRVLFHEREDRPDRADYPDDHVKSAPD